MQNFQKMMMLEFALKEEKALVKWEGCEGPPSSPKENWVPLGWNAMPGQDSGNCREVRLCERSGGGKACGHEASMAFLGKSFK